MYRPEGALDFTEAKLTRKTGCRYAGTIPAAAMHGAIVHYYVAAYDANNRVLAAKGSSGSPSALELGGAAARDPDPPGGSEPQPPPPSDHSSTGSGGGVTETARPPAARSKLAIAVSGGTGLGYVTGKTEGENMVQKCCIGSSLAVFAVELRTSLGVRTTIGAVARIGLPIGANIMGHSTIAPAGFVRLGHAFSDSGSGLHVTGEVGFGILRNTIQLATNTPGMDVDVVAQGPVLLGAGVGYTIPLSGSLSLLFDLDALAGIAIVNKLGTAINLNTGISADLRVGVAVGF
jgi:hypothetical protein